MTPKDKAIELVGKYKQIDIKILFIPAEIECKIKDLSYSIETAKQCALIAVDEILYFRNGMYINERGLLHQYLLDVKTEIEKL